MKYLIVLFALPAIGLSAQDKTELTAISTTLNYYQDGGTNNDFKTLEKAFHADATMQFMTAEGEHRSVNAISFFKERMKPGPAQDRKTRITSVHINGTAASARIEIDYPTFRFIDYMNLLKIGDEWKIVSKIFYKEDR